MSCNYCQHWLGDCPDTIKPNSKACHKRYEKAQDAEFNRDVREARGNGPSHEKSWGYNNPHQR